MTRTHLFLTASMFCRASISGCAVIAVADVVATVAVKTVGLAADAAIGTAHIAGKVVGASADAILPGSTP